MQNSKGGRTSVQTTAGLEDMFRLGPERQTDFGYLEIEGMKLSKGK